jgi:predicted exporter
LCAGLALEVENGRLGSYMAVSRFVPSIAVQRKNYALSSALLPAAQALFDALDFPPEAETTFAADFKAKKDAFAVIDRGLPSALEEALSSLWLGEINGNYYSCVFPVQPKADAPVFQEVANRLDHVFFMNKVETIARDLNALTRIIIVLCLAAYCLIAVIVKVFYSWRNTLKICASPVVLVLVTGALFLLLGIPFGFFAISAFILVFGLGLDYSFYAVEGARKEAATIPMVISFITTALAFGALVLSSFMPVHIFGLTVFIGLSTAFVTALLLKD